MLSPPTTVLNPFLPTLPPSLLALEWRPWAPDSLDQSVWEGQSLKKWGAWGVGIWEMSACVHMSMCRFHLCVPWGFHYPPTVQTQGHWWAPCVVSLCIWETFIRSCAGIHSPAIDRNGTGTNSASWTVWTLVEIYIHWRVGFHSLATLQTHAQAPSIFHSFVQRSTKPYPKHILNHNMPNHDPQFIPCLQTETLFSLSRKQVIYKHFKSPLMWKRSQMYKDGILWCFVHVNTSKRDWL